MLKLYNQKEATTICASHDSKQIIFGATYPYPYPPIPLPKFKIAPKSY